MKEQGTGSRVQGPEQKTETTEPWMRGTHPELDPLRRAVIHALEMAGEDVERWCGGLSKDALQARLDPLPSVSFHLRHMVRSLDRLLTYAEARQLNEEQLAKLGSERSLGTVAEVMREFRQGLVAAKERIYAIDPARYAESRGIGREQLPTTVAGLLIHCAEHTQRHAGQMVTTVKFVQALEGML